MKFDQIVHNALNQYPKLHLLEDVAISEGLSYCINNNLSIYENPYRIYSSAYFNLIQEARTLYINNILECTNDDAELLESDLGATAMLGDQIIYLDAPMLVQHELQESGSQGKHKLNKPFRTSGGPKKFAVYVRSKSGGVKKVTFGDPNLKIKNSNPTRAKSFRVRHKCSQKKDRTTAGYWSCNVGRYAKALGLKSSTPW